MIFNDLQSSVRIMPAHQFVCDFVDDVAVVHSASVVLHHFPHVNTRLVVVVRQVVVTPTT